MPSLLPCLLNVGKHRSFLLPRLEVGEEGGKEVRECVYFYLHGNSPQLPLEWGN